MIDTQPFGQFVRLASARGALVVQPRMGFSDPAKMRRGLRATRDVAASTVGTITLDSYTRVGDVTAAVRALAENNDLNGYPLVAHPVGTTRAMLDGIAGAKFPVQVRHGSARPNAIFETLINAGLTITEGGPVSYCLPYGRVPLRESVRNWVRCCEMLAASSAGQPHLETFGGCMLGQLCPPSLLVAISVLEGMFFAEHGISDISLSYAQQTSASQDAEAIAALRCLAGELIPDVDMHIVLYAYMGVYPRTADGALSLLGEAARLAVRTGSERLIVKTVAEAHRIPTIAENVQALGAAAGAADAAHASESAVPDRRALDSGIYAEARAIIETVLDLAAGQPGGLADALVAAFARGVLDVPFCLHPDNAGATRSYIDIDGRLRWAEIGALPIDQVGARGAPRSLTAADLLQSLTYVERTFDGPVLARSRAAAIGAKTRDDGWN